MSNFWGSLQTGGRFVVAENSEKAEKINQELRRVREAGADGLADQQSGGMRGVDVDLNVPRRLVADGNGRGGKAACCDARRHSAAAYRITAHGESAQCKQPDRYSSEGKAAH